MPKNWIDWSDWKPGQGQPEHPLSRPLKKGMTGATAVAEALSTGSIPVMGSAKPQPTNQEMFGHLEVTEEMAKKAKEEFENFFNDHFKRAAEALKAVVDKENLNKTVWNGRRSYNDQWREELSEEELAERNLFTGGE